MNAALEAGVEIPATVAERPEIEDEFRLYWEAWLDLSSDRPQGFGLGRIPWTSIDRFAVRFKVDDPEDFQTFKDVVTKVDRAFIAWHDERKKEG